MHGPGYPSFLATIEEQQNVSCVTFLDSSFKKRNMEKIVSKIGDMSTFASSHLNAVIEK